MLYQMGPGWSQKQSESYWPSLTNALAKKDYAKAIESIKGSRLYKQDPKRAKLYIRKFEEAAQEAGMQLSQNDINNLPPGYIIDAEGRIIGPNGLEANVNLTGRTNFNRSTNQNRFSKYYNIDDIALNDKFAQFLNFISSSKAEINVDFEDRNNEFSSSFYNFVHFSSAKERVNNFKHKLQLLENYTNTSASYVALAVS
jgi:hypothetical protein